MFLADNLRYLREYRAWTIEKMSDEMPKSINMTPEKLGHYERGTRQPSIEMLADICKYFKLPMDVMVRANLRKVKVDGIMKIGQHHLLLPILVDKHNKEQIIVVPAKSRAGYPAGSSDPEFFRNLPIMSLPYKVVGTHRAFPIIGDSMPSVPDGSFVVGKFVESPNEIENGQTYIVVTANDGLVYKRVYKKDKSALTLQSDNTTYQPYDVKLQDILELWKFVCCINLSDKKDDTNSSMVEIGNMLKDLNVKFESIRQG